MTSNDDVPRDATVAKIEIAVTENGKIAHAHGLIAIVDQIKGFYNQESRKSFIDNTRLCSNGELSLSMRTAKRFIPTNT